MRQSHPNQLRHRIRFDQVYSGHGGDYIALGFRVFDTEGRQVHRYVFRLSFEIETVLGHRHDLQRRSSERDDAIIDALLRWGIRRTEALLTEAPPAWQPNMTTTQFDVRADDLPELEHAWGPKACEFQLREPRRLICTAAFADDPTVIGREGLRFFAPTSESLCSTCAMPDAQYLCSHLINPEVTGLATDGGVVARRVIGAMCELGQPEISDPGGCRVGGHRCWERVVELRVSPEASLPPLSLVSTIDYVDASWRASSVSGHQDLFKNRRAAILADLAQPCTSRAEFFNRVSELDAVLKTIDAPKDDASFTRGTKGAGPLVRLREFLVSRLTASEDTAATAEDVRLAIDKLLRINEVRTAFQQVGADLELSAALAGLGIPFPPTDWSDAWRRIESEAVSALTTMARSLAELP